MDHGIISLVTSAMHGVTHHRPVVKSGFSWGRPGGNKLKWKFTSVCLSVSRVDTCSSIRQGYCQIPLHRERESSTNLRSLVETQGGGSCGALGDSGGGLARW